MTNAQRVRALAIARENGGGHAPCRWAWPNERNCWRTSQSGKWSPPKTKFTATGPSKRTIAKRAARRAAKRSH